MASFSRTLVGLFVFGAAVPAVYAQTPTESGVLTLDEALRMARERNGTIRSAEYDIRAAQARVAQANSAFFPTVTPEYAFSDIRRELDLQTFAQSGSVYTVRTTFPLLDAGQRDLSLRGSRRSVESTRYSSRQTLRSTLFTVTQQYYEALRAQELQRVSDSQVSRAQAILEQTKARIAVRDAAPIEELQANVDLQNALVNRLTARNRVTNSAASLRASIGLEQGESLKPLLKDATPPKVEVPQDSDTLVDEGLKNRPDLLSQRKNIEASEFSRRRAQVNATLGFNVSISDNYQVSPGGLNDRTLSVVATYPLFDGGQRRAVVRELQASVEASRFSLVQSERSARAEIEAAYAELKTNSERLTAAQTALEAARRNYEASEASRAAGASDLLNVLTAQVSLVTAESNYIEALYDTRISEARLRLVTGRPLPGE